MKLRHASLLLVMLACGCSGTASVDPAQDVQMNPGDVLVKFDVDMD